jgi:hypothetical protein
MRASLIIAVANDVLKMPKVLDSGYHCAFSVNITIGWPTAYWPSAVTSLAKHSSWS